MKHSISTISSVFFSLAQQTNATDLRNKIFNEPLKPYYDWDFTFLASTLFEQLEKKKSGLQDAGASSGPVYKLRDLIHGSGIPDANQLLAITKGVLQETYKIAPPPSQEYNLALHLMRYAQLIVNIYLAPKQQYNANVEDQTLTNVSSNSSSAVSGAEKPFQFISRLYRILSSGQTVSNGDQQRWNSEIRSVVDRRLNGLQNITSRTPTQNQELQVLQLVKSKMT